MSYERFWQTGQRLFGSVPTGRSTSSSIESGIVFGIENWLKRKVLSNSLELQRKSWGICRTEKELDYTSTGTKLDQLMV